MKLFLKRKSKSKSTSNQSVNDVSGLPSNTPPVKSSSLAARHSINLSPIKSEASITPVIVNATQSADTRQDQDVEDKEDKQKWHLVNHNLPIRRNFKYIPNTGYLMFNNRTQAHGVVGKVTHNDKRVSCYCYID